MALSSSPWSRPVDALEAIRPAPSKASIDDGRQDCQPQAGHIGRHCRVEGNPQEDISALEGAEKVKMGFMGGKLVKGAQEY
jgi:hypothetical protein